MITESSRRLLLGSVLVLTLLVPPLTRVGSVTASEPQTRPTTLPATPPAFDRNAFATLADADRLQFVLERLDARDRSLRNCSYKVKESVTNVRLDDGKRRFMTRSEYEFRRREDVYWMHLTTFKFNDPEGDVREEGTVGWDGKVGRGIAHPPYFGSDHPRCSIRPDQNNNFAYRKFNELLGFRVSNGIKPAVPLADWLRAAARRGDRIDVSLNEWRATRWVRVQVRTGFERQTVWLDPDRDFMVGMFDHWYEVNRSYNKRSSEVLAAEKVEGVWVPKRAVHRTGTSAYHEESEISYEVQEFNVGKVREEDVKVEFPEGSEVVDAVRVISYIILPNGKYKLLPIADTQAGVLRTPPDDPITDRIDDETDKKYKTQFLPGQPGLGPESKPSPPTSRPS